MTKTKKLTLGTALGALMLAGVPTMAFAQDDITQRNIPSLEYQQADVREALRALFRSVGASYTIAPDVQGLITVSLKNVPFEQALQQVIRQVEATYRIESGVYQIVKREEPVLNNQNPTDTGLPTNTNRNVRRRIKIRYADPQFIAILLGTDKGSQNFSLTPELSTVQNTPQGGGMGGFGGGGMGGFGGGGMGGFGGGMGGGGFGR